MPNYSPKVCVLLAAYNGTKFIEEQLRSILQQQNIELAIFISVDISTDNSYQWCCNFAQHHSQITVLPYGEKFGSAAPNFFRLIKDVDFSSFEYIALADQDDIWLDDKLISACRYIERDDLAAYSSNVLAFWSDGSEQLIDKSQPQKQYDYLFESAAPGCSYVLRVAPFIEFKKLLLSQWQQASQVALHDWFIYAFFRARGYRWFIDPEYKLRHRQHDDNHLGVNKGWRAAYKRLRLFKNGWYRKQTVLIAELVGIKNINFDSRWVILTNIGQLRRRRWHRFLLFVLALVGLY